MAKRGSGDGASVANREEAEARLFGVPPEAFVATRGELARVLRARGEDLPLFAVPRSSTDEGYLTLARQFARDAALLDAEFSGHGLGSDVIRRVAGAFEASVRDCATNRANVIVARTRIHDLVRSARLEVRRLDLIVGSGLAPDNTIRAVWQQTRRVERRRGPRSGNGAAEADADRVGAAEMDGMPHDASSAAATTSATTASPGSLIDSCYRRRSRSVQRAASLSRRRSKPWRRASSRTRRSRH